MTVETAPYNVADLLDSLGGIPPERVLLKPPPGTATEKDALRLIDAADKRLVELVNGTLVAKPCHNWLSYVNAHFTMFIGKHILDHDLGIIMGPGGPLRMNSGNVLLPAFSFIAWENFPNEEFPKVAVLDVAPTLIVEILSPSNTRREIEQKLKEYFDKGCKQSWIVDPEDKTVKVHTTATEFKLLGVNNTLTGGDILPGFKLKISELFPPKRRKRKK